MSGIGNNDKLTEKLNLLRTLWVIGDVDKLSCDDFASSTIKCNKCYAISKENINKFNDLIFELYKEEWKISKDCFINIIYSNIDNLNYDALIKEILGKEMQTYTIVRILYGCYLKNNPTIKLGKYTFYNQNEGETIINDSVIHDDFFTQNNKKSGDYVYASINVESRESKMALELADLEFSKLENILRYMSGILDKSFGIGIFTFRSWDIIENCILNNTAKTIGFGSSANNSAVRTIEIDDEWYVDFNNEKGNGYIWNTTKKENLNEIEKRIMRAVFLIGNAINTIDNQLAFLQFVMAIEATIQIQEDFITKSIAAQLRETAAFIIANDKEGRMEIDKLVRDIYKTRSAISHGNNKDITDKLLWDSFFIAKQLIAALTTKNEFKLMTRSNELLEYIEDKRYESYNC